MRRGWSINRTVPSPVFHARRRASRRTARLAATPSEPPAWDHLSFAMSWRALPWFTVRVLDEPRLKPSACVAHDETKAPVSVWPFGRSGSMVWLGAEEGEDGEDAAVLVG